MLPATLLEVPLENARTADATNPRQQQYSIREVIAFPFMKDEKKGEEKKLAAEEVGIEALPTEEARECTPPPPPSFRTPSGPSIHLPLQRKTGLRSRGVMG